jgi:hypothetical protein
MSIYHCDDCRFLHSQCKCPDPGPPSYTNRTHEENMKIREEVKRLELRRLEQENQELRECLQWYIESDDTNEGGKWEEVNAPWLRGKRRAMRALGMETE